MTNLLWFAVYGKYTDNVKEIGVVTGFR